METCTAKYMPNTEGGGCGGFLRKINPIDLLAILMGCTVGLGGRLSRQHEEKNPNMAQVQGDSEKGDPSKSQKNAQHSALSAQAKNTPFESTVHFWGTST